MKKISILLMLMAMFTPLAMNGQRAALYSEGFEGMSSASDLTSAGWISYQTHSGSFLAIETTASNVHSGSKALNIDSWSAGSSSDYVVVGLPAVNATINTLQITFSYKVSTGTVYVGYLTDANDASSFVSLQSFSSSSSYTTKTVELTDAPATAGRIAIKYLNWYRCYVDDIKVETIPSCYEPQNLTASLTSCNGSIATLNWDRNPKGSENAWVLQVATNDAFTANLQSYPVSNTPSKDLTGLTPETTYYARVKASCGTNDESDWSATCEFKPTDACSIVVSEGTSTNGYAPLYGNYKSSYDQMIYTASQLEDAGITGPCSITRIGFNSSAANTVARKPVIYICQTDKNAFSSTSDFVSINEFTKVYDYNDNSQWNIAAGWNEFELDTPFDYDGSSNLIIAMHCGIASNYSSTSFYASTASGYQVIYAYHDSTDPNPATYEGNWSSFPNKNYSTSLPSLKLYYEPVAVTCDKPTGLAIVANSLTAHSVAMQWNSEANAVYDYAIVKGTGIDPTTVTYAGSETATGTTCSHTWSSGLDGDSDYTVFIRKNCGNGDYSNPATKVIHTEVACAAPVDFTAVVNGTSVTLSWTGANSDIAWSLNANANPDDYIDPDFNIDQAHGTATMSNMALDTDYYFWVRTNCGGIDGTSTWVGPVSVHIGYCVPNPSSRDGKGITNLTFGDDLVVNNSDETNGLPASAPYYGNYTSMVGSAEPGSNVNVSITYATGSSTVYSYGTIIWVDWDNSLSFEDNEIVYTGTSAQGSNGVPQVLEASFTVPANQASGDYRMRIAGADSYFDNYIGGSTTANHSACFSSSYAVCHDYTLRVAQVSCPTPIPGNVTDLMPTSATLNWTSDADDFYVRYRTAAHEEATFFDDFESGDLNGWTVYTNGESLLDLGLSYNGWFVYNIGQNHGDGSYVANAWSYYQFDDETYGTFDADNWLITPQVTLGGTLKFWVWANYSDEFEVLLSTSGTATSNFTTTLRSMQAPSANQTWEEVSIDLSSYSGQGYIAIHHVFENGWYLLVDDFGIYANVEAGQWLPNATGANTSDNSLDITGLTPEKEYEWQVMADCGTDGESNWSTIATFTTPSPCAAPSDLNTTDITAASAKLNWTGAQENYNVSYGKVLFYDGFESGNLTQGGWTVYTEGESPNTDGWYAYNASSNWTNHNGTYSASAWSWSSSAYNADNWLVTPQVALQGTLSFWVYGNYADEYEVLLSTGGNTTSDFNVTLKAMAGAPNRWTEINIDLSSYNGAQGYIAIHHVFNDGNVLLVDDFGIYDLQSTTSTASNVTVNGLEPMTEYIWKVQGDDCDGNGSTTDWSEVATFTTPEGYILHIPGYGTSTGGYWLIASPINATVDPENVTSMLTNSYDLYAFDQTGGDNNREWRNYKANSFNLEPGQGYLYANSADVDLVFTGSAYQGTTFDVTLTKATSPNFEGWNLVGNPFAEEIAYIADGRDFYTMQEDGSKILVSTSNTIQPMEGVFVVATTNGETMTFTTTAPQPQGSKFVLNLNDGHNVIDRAIVRFGQGRQLPKLQLFKNDTKVYIPMDGQDYAVVCAEEMGEMPVNFRAESNGTYSLSLSTDNVEFAYLHLIDNLTGNDVDLLQTPSYSFEAKTTDYTSRFKLVFATGNNTDSFAFYSNGSFVINNEGNATLQVIDVNGRVIKSESINGCTNVNVNAAPGVYMIRLVNGDNVKVQKVVVR